MTGSWWPAPLAALLGCLAARPAPAQIDYRNLDDDRPTAVEDAYPVERFAFELLLPYRFERARGFEIHAVVPELEYGLLPNFALGIKAPLAQQSAPGSTQRGLSSLRLFALYNFNTEGNVLPALSLRADASLPVGSLAGDATRVSIKGIMTRSFGMSRVHLTGAYALGRAGAPPLVEGIPRWWGGGALDYTLFRQSALLVGEVYVRQAASGVPAEVNAGLGIRWQWTPTLVLDAGVSRRLSADGPDVGLTIGLSHVFGIPRSGGGGR